MEVESKSALLRKESLILVINIYIGQDTKSLQAYRSVQRNVRVLLWLLTLVLLLLLNSIENILQLSVLSHYGSVFALQILNIFLLSLSRALS